MSYPDCAAMEELIALDAGGDLDGADEQRLESHLASCPECRKFAAEMRRSQQAVRRLAEIAVGGDVLAGVRSAVLEEIASSGRRTPSILRFPSRALPAHHRWLAAAAAILLMAGAGWWLAGRSQETPAQLPEIARHLPPPPPIEPPHLEERPAVPETVEPRTARAVEPPPPKPLPLKTWRPPVAVAEAGQPESQPMVVKWIVDDPDLVIYWLIDTDKATEETTNEPKEA